MHYLPTNEIILNLVWAIALSYFCYWQNRRTSDIIRSIKMYNIIALSATAVLVIIGLNIWLILFTIVLGNTVLITKMTNNVVNYSEKRRRKLKYEK